MAWHLARQHLRFVVLEAGPEPGHIWRSRGSALLGFVREDAAYLADRITSRAPARRSGGQVLARR